MRNMGYTKITMKSENRTDQSILTNLNQVILENSLVYKVPAAPKRYKISVSSSAAVLAPLEIK